MFLQFLTMFISKKLLFPEFFSLTHINLFYAVKKQLTLFLEREAAKTFSKFL